MGCIPSRGSDDFEKLHDGGVLIDKCAIGVRHDGRTVSGEGCALADTSIQQSKAYFEVTVRKLGDFALGITHESHDLHEKLGTTDASWAIWSDGSVRHKGLEKHKYDSLNVNVNSVIGIAFDQSDLPSISFYVNGDCLGFLVLNLKGDVIPAVYVSDGASLQVNFGYDEDFNSKIPDGYEIVMKERTLLSNES